VSPLDGSLDAPGDRDWYDLGKLPGASLFSLSATGAATGVAATEAGAAGDRALPSNLHVDLYQSNAGSPVLLTSSTDGLIENFTLPAPDSYFAVVTADPSTAGVGAYHFGALLDAARPAPAGASAPAEQEPNDDAASATPIGGRWRDMVYSADRAFDLEWFDYEALGDIDYAEYRFTQGDLLSVAFQQYDGATLSGVRIALRDDQDHAVASFDGTAFDPAVTRGGMYGIVIPQTGRYFLSMQSIASSGGAIHAYLKLAATTPPPPFQRPTSPPTADYYRLPLKAGVQATIALQSNDTASKLSLLDSTGKVVQQATTTYDRYRVFTLHYTPAADGAFYVRPEARSGQAYTLMAMRGADHMALDHDTSASAQPLGPAGTVTGYLTTDAWFSFKVAAGGTRLRLNTYTPNLGPLPVFNLNPSLELYGPNGTRVASDDNSGAGGSDRVTLTWPAGRIKDTWLQVTLRANDRTGLGAADTFYIGNLAADAGDVVAGPGDAVVNSLDLGIIRRHLFEEAGP